MAVSSRIKDVQAASRSLNAFYFQSRYGKRRAAPDICDFTFGNPHEMPLPEIVSAIRTHAVPKDENWFAYKASEAEPRSFLAEHVGRELGLAFEPADIALTSGAFAAIALIFHLTLDQGDEAIFSEPAWFCYEPMLLAAHAVPRKVALAAPSFDLDLSAIDAAIGQKTKLVIVNTPHNPTGRIYTGRMLRDLADLLERASARVGHRIYLLSDEPYRRLRFDGRAFDSPASFYPWTFISYSYGKVLLSPGQRLGYMAISPLMPPEERRAFQQAAFPAQVAIGWSFPNAVMQYAVPDLEKLSIDQAALARRRDRLLPVLRQAGCEPLVPEGTFYLWSRWPDGEPDRHWSALADRDVFVLPGSLMNAEHYFRISLTASDAMVEKALPVFAQADQGG
ncbi:MAG: aminotransferase class I/II-fold pyridoxal phosphate-dependent enzyme [Bradyrhizobium sp.]|uniref:aminotransferase class I/II-fold pyridoxal phosphate-dependent enzyme n=1 Tax=Bradyrhizobium sp. TaxID=376 RepID=UPI001D4BA52D|nr:aminotransferase class I/II-fold pyridoxal phosphate-dependent enzyme [Bradyrhizobium sp.]MBV9563916.1 aminotransferase class I/II-fold pyridoxal phosphate-dependent enzyme [Bradyrhizobium sp.]